MAASIQSPIFGGFLPLSIPILEKVDLGGLEMSTVICIFGIIFSPSPCAQCGEADPVVLEFHQIGGKDLAISEMITRVSSVDRLKEELQKTRVLCANCHRRITAQERGWLGSKRGDKLNGKCAQRDSNSQPLVPKTSALSN